MELTLIAKIRDIQSQKGLPDKEMAKRLGCSRQLWQMTRTGKTPIGSKIMKNVSKAFPELQQDVIYFLTNDAQKCPNNAQQNPLKQPSEAQGRGLKRVFVELLRRLRKWQNKRNIHAKT